MTKEQKLKHANPIHNCIGHLKNKNKKYHQENTSLVAWSVKSLPAMQETWVRFLGQEDHLEKEMATHSSILPGKSHGRGKLAGYSPQDHKTVRLSK